MKIKTAILQVADQGPAESLIVMLHSVGIQCCFPSDPLKAALRQLGCDTVLDIEGLVKNWGYEVPMRLETAGPSDMGRSDVLYVDVKGHRNGPLVWKRWPNLEKRTLWYRINAGEPQHVITSQGVDCGDEVNPPCPILTPNQWYRLEKETGRSGKEYLLHPWADRAYCCWPPFYRFDEYYPVHGRSYTDHSGGDCGPPACLIHNASGWGYSALLDTVRELGIKCYGAGSPDGLVNHARVPSMLSRALCMVHLKSSDAPGYALYEAMAAGCPVVCTRRLIWRCKMEELLIPEETCLVFDRIGHQGLTPQDVEDCRREISLALERLLDKEENRRIGLAGRQRLKELMWDEGKDLESLRGWLEKMYS